MRVAENPAKLCALREAYINMDCCRLITMMGDLKGPKMIAILFVTIFSFQFITTTEIFPERVETESGNSCLHTINFTFRKRSRNSPYYIDFDFNATAGYGNNLTIKWKLNEYISGRYVPIPVLFEYSLCDFLYKDPYLGQMYAKQLRGNWSCPFGPGRSIFKNLVTHVENIPIIPFTYASLIVRIRVDLIFSIGPPIEQVAVVKVYMTVRQKIKKSKF